MLLRTQLTLLHQAGGAGGLVHWCAQLGASLLLECRVGLQWREEAGGVAALALDWGWRLETACRR